MILVVGKDKQLEKIVEESKFSEMGVWERTHMEEWIAEHPEILGEKEKLLTITTEYDGFDKTNKRLDILAVDNNGKLVVIELKRDVAETFVDLQAIHYAAYCSTLTLDDVTEIAAEYHSISKDEVELKINDFIDNKDFSEFDNQPRIILVANDFKEDTLAAVLWLRDSGIDITCVKLDAHQVEKKIVITPSVIIPLPEAKQFMMFREEKTKITATKKPNEMSEFWAELLKEVRRLKPEIPDRRPYKSTYFPVNTEYKNVHFEWAFKKRPNERLMVCLHFEKPSRNDNKKIFEYFVSQKELIKERLSNEEVIFDENFGKNWMQIYIQNNSANLDEKNIKWGSEAMVKLYEALKPILDDYYSKK